MEPNLDILPEREWQADEKMQVETAFLPRMWNCFDESAVAMALHLQKESTDISDSSKNDTRKRTIIKIKV